MKRGEIWTVSGGQGYAGKPRPAVIIQDDRFDATASITICAFTTDPTALVSSGGRAEHGERAQGPVPTDGGQDHNGGKN